MKMVPVRQKGKEKGGLRKGDKRSEKGCFRSIKKASPHVLVWGRDIRFTAKTAGERT